MSSTFNTIPFPSVVITTSGVPSNSVGIDGQFAWDATASTLYGPKTAGVWPAGVVLKGTAGPANTLTIGTVTTGPAAATITGTPPNQILNLTIPQGLQGPPGGLTSRTTTSVTTSTIAPGAVWTGTVSLAPAFALVGISLNFPGWLRVYPTAAARIADAARPINEDPAVTVTAEIATGTVGVELQAPYRSGVIGSNLDNPPVATQYLTLRNLDSVSRTFEIRFHYIALEV